MSVKSLTVNFLLSLGVCVSCLIGDKLVELSRLPILKAICDNLTHGVVGLLSAILLVINIKEKLQHKESCGLVTLCLLISCVIDVDHFIAAKSMQLVDATNLSSRPFLHNSSIPAVLLVALLYSIFITKQFKNSLWISIILLAFLSHHLRDSTRRGLLFSPFKESTRPVPYLVYILTTVVLPLILSYLLNSGNYVRSYSKLSQTIDV